MVSVVSAQAPSEKWDLSTEPSLVECLCLLLMAFAIQSFEYIWHGSFWNYVSRSLDNKAYVDLAMIIRDGHFPTAYPPLFLGLPCAIALVSRLFSISELTTLVFISIFSSIATAVLISRLYGSSVAIVFAIVSVEWIKISILGGSEPLFTLLFLSSFACARTERWSAASLLASLGTTVRPVGIFALAGIGIALLQKRNWTGLLRAISIAVLIGSGYLWLTRWVTTDAFANFKMYQSDWGASGFPLAFPLTALIRSAKKMIRETHWNVGLRYAIWTLISIQLAVAALLRSKSRSLLKTYTVEGIAATGYFLFFLCYNYNEVLAYWPRFVIPILPMLLLPLGDALPKNSRILWPAAALSALLASSSVVTFKAVFGFSLHR